jgi:hypothetical protein
MQKPKKSKARAPGTSNETSGLRTQLSALQNENAQLRADFNEDNQRLFEENKKLQAENVKLRLAKIKGEWEHELQAKAKAEEEEFRLLLNGGFGLAPRRVFHHAELIHYASFVDSLNIEYRFDGGKPETGDLARRYQAILDRIPPDATYAEEYPFILQIRALADSPGGYFDSGNGDVLPEAK